MECSCVVVVIVWLGNVLRATTACTFSTSEPPKVARTCGALYILTSKCASRHNGVHFCDISTSKSGPELVCFVHFDFKMYKMCFAPQRRALFRHRNFQKWSEAGVFCTFWLQKCASCHNGVQLFISHLASCLRTRRFSEPTFRPSGDTNESRLSYLFAHLHLLSSDSFSSTLLSSNLSLLSASALLCFSSVHMVGSLTSKLPSIIVWLLFTIGFTIDISFGFSQHFQRNPLDMTWPEIHALSHALSHLVPNPVYSWLSPCYTDINPCIYIYTHYIPIYGDKHH